MTALEYEAMIRNVIWLLFAPERRIDRRVAGSANCTFKGKAAP